MWTCSMCPPRRFSLESAKRQLVVKQYAHAVVVLAMTLASGYVSGRATPHFVDSLRYESAREKSDVEMHF